MAGLELMSAMILAGGLGSRLRPVVSDRAKGVALVGGRAFLGYVLEQIEAAGIGRVILCTGHMGGQVRKTFGERFGGMALSYSQEDRPMGTGGALALAAARHEGERFLVMNGDSYCRADLVRFMGTHETRQAMASILLTEVADGSRFGRVRCDDGGSILSFEEKKQGCGGARINAGVYVIERTVLERIPRDVAVSLEREVFPMWVGLGLYGHMAAGPFIDIGTPQSYAQAEQFFAREKAA